jgi:hypothetical protein
MSKQQELKDTLKPKDGRGREISTTLSQGLIVNIEEPQPDKGPADHTYISFAGIKGWVPKNKLKDPPKTSA